MDRRPLHLDPYGMVMPTANKLGLRSRSYCRTSQVLKKESSYTFLGESTRELWNTDRSRWERQTCRNMDFQKKPSCFQDCWGRARPTIAGNHIGSSDGRKKHSCLSTERGLKQNESFVQRESPKQNESFVQRVSPRYHGIMIPRREITWEKETTGKYRIIGGTPSHRVPPRGDPKDTWMTPCGLCHTPGRRKNGQSSLERNLGSPTLSWSNDGDGHEKRVFFLRLRWQSDKWDVHEDNTLGQYVIHPDSKILMWVRLWGGGGDTPAQPSVVPRKDTRLTSLVITLLRVISVVLSPHSNSVAVEDTTTNLRDNEDLPESWSRTTDCDCDNASFTDYQGQQKQKIWPRQGRSKDWEEGFWTEFFLGGLDPVRSDIPTGRSRWTCLSNLWNVDHRMKIGYDNFFSSCVLLSHKL